MPAAGKATMGGMGGNMPLGDLTKMQNALSALLIQKQNVSIIALFTIIFIDSLKMKVEKSHQKLEINNNCNKNNR